MLEKHIDGTKWYLYYIVKKLYVKLQNTFESFIACKNVDNVIQLFKRKYF